jgi:hypothetical protein
MKIGLIGLPESGRFTLYSLLTGTDAIPGENAQCIGIAAVHDPRFDRLTALFMPKKETPARIIVELMPQMDEQAIRDGGIFKDIAGTDALCLIIRAFSDESVYHIHGSVNPMRDIDSIISELIMHDIIFIDKRLERLADSKKKARDQRSANEEPLLQSMKEHLEQDLPLRVMDISREEMAVISGYPLITMKELVIALNVNEGDLSNSAGSAVSDKYKSHRCECITLSAKLESEIAALDSNEERDSFMRESGITEPSLSKLTRACMSSLGLISYFTVGPDEVRQWMVRRNSTAPEAARVIHSDIERGFIRAEVMKFGDLTELGSEEAVKRAGKFRLEGKEYQVEDGDIISFRFNV